MNWNNITINPGECQKIRADLLGYEIHDAHGKPVFSINTRFDYLPALGEKCWITTLNGDFFDRLGKVVVHAHMNDDDEEISAACKCFFGYKNGGFGIVLQLDKDDLQFAAICLSTRGKIYERITGIIENEQVNLDGKYLLDCELRNCTVHLSSGDFALERVRFVGCSYTLSGQANRIREYLQHVIDGAVEPFVTHIG